MVKQKGTKAPTEMSVQDLIDMEDGEDQSVETGGDFERTLPPEGDTLARFVEYVELGLQPQRPYMGKDKPPAEEVNLVFELLSPDNVREVEVNGVMTQFTDKIYITVAKKLSGRAKFKKLFEAMRYGRDNIKHMKKMLGEAFIVTVVHGSSKTNPEKIYANIGNKDSVGIRGPFTVNVKTRKQVKEDVPEATMPLKIFLQDNPTKASWDSLFIDGEYENREGKTQSKNFIQNKILASPSFEGSALESLLEGTGDLPELAEEETVEEAKAPAVRKSVTKKPLAQPTPKAAAQSAPVKLSSVKAAGTPVSAPKRAVVQAVQSVSPSKVVPVSRGVVQKPARKSTKDAFAAIGLNTK